MNWTLFRKEITGLRLVLWLALILFSLDIGYTCFTTFPDHVDNSGDERSNAIFSLLMIGIVIGVVSMNQERNHQTVPFLDGLPVSRWTLFWHKMLAALVVGAVVNVVGEILDAVKFWLASDSLSKPYSFTHSVAEVSMEILLGSVIIGWATLLSFAQKWFPLVAAMVLWIFIWFRMLNSDVSSYLDSFALLDVTGSVSDSGQSLASEADQESNAIASGVVRLPWKQIAGHSVIGVIAWIATWIVFQYRDGWLTRTAGHIASWKLAGALTVIGQLMAVGLLAAAMGWFGRNHQQPMDAETSAAGTSFPSNSVGNANADSMDSFGRYQTEQYEVIFKESQRELVNHYYWSLDSIYKEVQLYFQNAEGPPGRIVLDTASLVSTHASGQANWTKIRVPMMLHTHSGTFLDTVRHETAHVFIETLSQGEAASHFTAMRMFHEGVATAAELSTDRIGEDGATLSDKIAKQERWAAGVDSRGRIPLDKLCDDSWVMQNRDPFVVYPLGYVVARSLVEAGGPGLPRKMMETLAKTSLPPGVRPIELWRIVLQKCGVSLDMVIANYEEQLDQLDTREATFIAGLPRVKTTVVVEDGSIVITPSVEGEADADAYLVCQIERDRILMNEPQQLNQAVDGSFRMQRSMIPGKRIRYMLGWVHPESANTIYEPWQEKEIGE